jgi:hypothetical protein
VQVINQVPAFRINTHKLLILTIDIMKKITLLFLLFLATTYGFAQNFITNGAFDDATGWTIVNQYGTDSTNGSVTIAGGTAVIAKIDPTDGGWIHMGLYTSLNLTAGWYQFDMDMAFDGTDSIWGEVYIGASEPEQNAEYFGDLQVIKAYNAWDCPQTYTGAAVAFGCDDSSPGKFEITSDGMYYLLFRTGGATYGPSGITLDNLTLVTTTAEPAPVPLTVFNFDFSTPTPIGTYASTFDEDAINTVTDGINTTPEVGEISGVNDDWYSQLNYEYNDGFDLSSGDRGISLKVKGPRVSSIKIKVESGSDPDAEFTVDYTTPNVWQELIFDFTSFSSSNNTKVAVFFDFETNFDAGVDPALDVFQVDDFVLGAFSALNITDYGIDSLSVYPNPTHNSWNISTTNQIINTLEVFDILGKRVVSLKPNSSLIRVDTSNLRSGIYITKISTEFGTAIKRLIKQ